MADFLIERLYAGLAVAAILGPTSLRLFRRLERQFMLWHEWTYAEDLL